MRELKYSHAYISDAFWLESKNNSRTSIDTYTYRHTCGNEVAYQLAKEGSKKQQPKSKLSYQDANTLIRNKRLAD